MRLHLPKRLRRLATVVALSAAVLLVGGCSEAEKDSIKRLAQPEGVTDRTDGIHSLWMGSWLAAMLVGVLVWGLIGYACVKFYRRRDDEIPVQTRYNLPIEILYTVAPRRDGAGAVLLHRQRAGQDVLAAETTGADADHTVTVVGQQWSWTFNYDKDAALDGRTTVFDSGTTADRPTLYLPVDKSVRVQAPLARRHPLVLGAGVPVQDGRRPGAREPLQPHARPVRARSRQVRGAVRHLPLADAVRREGRQRERLRGAPQGAAGARQHRPGTRRHRGRQESRPRERQRARRDGQ